MRAPSRSTTIPPPVEGWDTREALADMPIKRAVILDNWFPETDRVTLRRGHASHVTGLGSSVESVMPYVPLTGSGKLFGAAGGSIYNVSSAGAVGGSVSSGHSNNRWQHVQIGTAAGQFLRLFNGASTPLLYDGSSWATTAITGPTATNLIWGNLHQRRLWTGEKDSLSAWYLAVNSISGSATEFSLAGLASAGGYIMGMGTWTFDAGDGVDDVAVFLTSEGQAIVYQGIDPSSASSWGLVGVFQIGKPIGRRCMIKAGADLVMVTQDGFVSASTILSMNRAQAERVALSAQINKAVNDAVREKGSIFGWQPVIYPKGAMLIFNIPQSTTTAHQYVFNTITGAPCRFKGNNAQCFGEMNDNLYFGSSDGTVYKFDSGTSDNGTNIEGDALQAFSFFKSPGTNKAFKMVEPIFQCDGNPSVALDLNTDFQIKAPTNVATASPSSKARWGIGKWGVGLWGGADQIYRGWRGVRGIGRSASLRVRVNTTTTRPSWLSTSFTYVPGGQI